VLTGVADKILDAVKAGQAVALLRHRRLRRRGAGPQLLRRVRRQHAGGYAHPHAGLRQVPHPQRDFGTIDLAGVGEIPRLLDMGQCNDSYGAIQVAVKLAEALGCGVNDLPLTIVLSWFEQKAVAVLLTLLHLGVKGIRIGPRPPAFVSPNVFKILQDKYDLPTA
jgi:hydroxylamine reductase